MYKIYGLTNKCPQLQFSVFADAVVSISLNLLPMIAALIAAMCSVAQSCLTLCDLEDYSLPGSSVHGISQEYWSGLSLPSPGDLPDPGIEPVSPASAGRFFITEAPRKLNNCLYATYHIIRF